MEKVTIVRALPGISRRRDLLERIYDRFPSDCRSRKQKRKTQSITRSRIEHCDWFTLPLLLSTPTMQFSLHRKQRSHKRMQCSASDSIRLTFTRSHRSTLLITTPTTTPSLVETSLKTNRMVVNRLKDHTGGKKHSAKAR